MADVALPDGLVPGALTLEGVDGNAFAVMGAVSRALRDAGNPPEVIDWYRKESMAGDYDHLLRVALAVTEHPRVNCVIENERVHVCRWCARPETKRDRPCATREDGGSAEHDFYKTWPVCPRCRGDGCVSCHGFGWVTESAPRES